MADILSDTVAAYASGKHAIIDKALEEIGWLTPDTYGRDFSPPLPISALYIFSLFNYEKCSSRPLYVGQSRNLKNRWLRHPILQEIERSETGPWQWVIRLFIPWDPVRLRQDERYLIGRLNPPFNIIGRPRGVA